MGPIGAMAAMIGGDEGAVRQLAADTDVDVANLNSPGQIVISGERAKVEIAVGLGQGTRDPSRHALECRWRLSFAPDG